MEGSLHYRKKKCEPTAPNNFDDLVQKVDTEIGKIDGQQFYRGHSSSNAGDFIVFSSNSQLECLSVSSVSSVDSTFKITPSSPKRCFYQLLVICSKELEHFHPLVYILMSNKTYKLYKEVFTFVHQICPRFSPNIILSDFESAQTKALKERFSSSTLQGCWFHFVQALLRKINVTGLIPSYRRNERFKSFVKRLFCLPLLPENLIVSAFSEIKSSAEQESFFNETISSLFDCVEHY